MRIIQLIDSLEAGGAERMAVNYANALADTIDFSGLVTSRKGGTLLNQLNDTVSYLNLNKKSTLDLKALYKLRQFVKENKIEVVHAHSTSFFIASLLKLTYPSVRLIWHDHYGDSEFLDKRPLFSLKVTLPFFEGIIAVNQKLKTWAEQKIKFKNVVYLPNFPSLEKEVSKQTVLKGIEGKRILCLANLRVQKNHFLLLDVAKRVKNSHPDWTFHLVGKDFQDEYSKQIKSLVLELNLEQTVFIYDSRKDVNNIIEQSTIAILTSQSEGLPVALLEYGRSRKPVVVTDVGEIPLVVQNDSNGFVIASNNLDLFYISLVDLMDDEFKRINFGTSLFKTIENQFSENGVIKQYLYWLKNNRK